MDKQKPDNVVSGFTGEEDCHDGGRHKRELFMPSTKGPLKFHGCKSIFTVSNTCNHIYFDSLIPKQDLEVRTRSLLFFRFPHLTRLMASVTDSSCDLRITFIMILFFSLTFLPPISVGSSMLSRGSEDMKQKKMILGSRPPQCVNKCFNCKPCMTALVTPPHHKNCVKGPSSSTGDESYYLLSWKCRCGDKFFQP